jgi:hypothetical protein
MTGANSTYHTRWVFTAALIYLPLERTKANQEQYELVQAAGRLGDVNRGGGGNGGSDVRLNVELEESHIEHPHSLSPNPRSTAIFRIALQDRYFDQFPIVYIKKRLFSFSAKACAVAMTFLI